ncbi:hypothetical protein [Phytohabitans rumicis]|nr:hypothetical protein [Phytohabitans rumicis]
MTRLRRTALSPLAAAVDAGVVTARGAANVLRLVWTIEDIDGRDQPNRDDSVKRSPCTPVGLPLTPPS